jgi:hypothetical protein
MTRKTPSISKSLNPAPTDGYVGILNAFRTYPLVALGEAHWLQQEADFITRLLQNPYFPRLVQTLVVEFGSAQAQPIVDRFLVGERVTEAELHSVWRWAGGAGHAFESPIYAQFFHTVRALNQRLPSARRLRVLLGDPPVDDQTGQRDPAIWSLVNARDAYYAMVVEDQVLRHGVRALLIAGGGHFSRISDTSAPQGNVVQRLELKYPGSIFVVVPHVIFEETMAIRAEAVRELETRLAGWPVPALATLHGTWLGEIDAYLHFDNLAKRIEPDGTERFVRVPYIGLDGAPITELRLSDMVDALLYLGPQDMLTFTPPTPPSDVASS